MTQTDKYFSVRIMSVYTICKLDLLKIVCHEFQTIALIVLSITIIESPYP